MNPSLAEHEHYHETFDVRTQIEELGLRLTVVESLIKQVMAIQCGRGVDEMPETIKMPLIRDIKEAVSRHYKIPVLDLIGKTRSHNTVRPRHIAMYLCRKGTLNGFPAIGKHFGDRDHTSVMHGFEKISELRQTDPGLAHDLEQLEAELGMVKSD